MAVSHQHSFEEPALRDVKASVLGQNLDVLHFIVEPANRRRSFLSSLYRAPSLKSARTAESKCKKKKKKGKNKAKKIKTPKHCRFTNSGPSLCSVWVWLCKYFDLFDPSVRATLREKAGISLLFVFYLSGHRGLKECISFLPKPSCWSILTGLTLLSLKKSK